MSIETMKFLVVDDSECWRYFVKSVFEKNHDVIECEDGAQVLEAYTEHRPDWVLIDVQMAIMDGLTAALKLKTRFPGARVVFVSQYSDPSFRNQATSMGADGYVTKEDFSQLFAIIHADQPRPPSP